MESTLPANTERLASLVVDSGLKVHRALGPGLLESAYEHCLAHELEKRGCRVKRQVTLPVFHEGMRIDAGYRMDLVVDDTIVVEVKSAAALTPLFHAQMLTYLKLSGCHLGFLITFNVPLFRDGVKRILA